MDETDDTKNRHDLRPLPFLLAEQRKRLVQLVASLRRAGPGATAAAGVGAELLELGHEIAVYAAIGSATLSQSSLTRDDMVGSAELHEQLVKLAKDL